MAKKLQFMRRFDSGDDANPLVTPKGESIWPYISEPQTLFDKDGVYKVDLAVDADEAKPFIDRMEALFEEELKANEAFFKQKLVRDRKEAEKKKEEFYEPKNGLVKINGLPWYDEYVEDENDGSEYSTGRVVIKIKTNATYTKTDKSTGKKETMKRVIRVVDRFGRDMFKHNIYGGTTMRVFVTASSYYSEAAKTYGIRLNMDLVQVDRYISGVGRGADYKVPPLPGVTPLAEEDETPATETETAVPPYKEEEDETPATSPDDKDELSRQETEAETKPQKESGDIFDQDNDDDKYHPDNIASWLDAEGDE